MKTEILRMQNVFIGDETAKYALRNFHLEVFKGEMVSLLGVSNSGKTALYYYFIGEEALREGKVTYRNQIWKQHEKFSAVKDIICIGQKSTLIPSLTIAENLCIITGKRKVRGFINKKAINYRTNMLLNQYALGLSAEMPVSGLSLVQRHTVELLRAVENEADLVYIDDAFSTYGQFGMQSILGILKVLKEKNISVIYASKRKDHLTQQLADRVVVLRQGENVKTFYRENYDEDLCRKWLIGNPEITEFKRQVFKTDEEVFQTSYLTGPKYIKNVNIQVSRGEIVGFYDMNNCANLEVMDMFIGEKAPVSGCMYLNGKLYSPGRIDDAIAANVGYVPRQRSRSGVVDTMSFAENLLLPIMLKMSVFSIFKNERVKRFLEKEYIEKMGIKEQDKDLEVSSFNSYVRNNVIFRKWILAKPDLLVCVDICEETDIKMRNIIYKSVEELAKNKSAILISSQNLGELKSICDTIYLMNSNGTGERVKEIHKLVVNETFVK